jgi:hypothetical protein
MRDADRRVSLAAAAAAAESCDDSEVVEVLATGLASAPKFWEHRALELALALPLPVLRAVRGALGQGGSARPVRDAYWWEKLTQAIDAELGRWKAAEGQTCADLAGLREAAGRSRDDGALAAGASLAAYCAEGGQRRFEECAEVAWNCRAEGTIDLALRDWLRLEPPGPMRAALMAVMLPDHSESTEIPSP